MSGCILDWQALEDKKSAARLQGFVCTQPWPTTPGGRRLPKHPRSYEWDAQRHVRCLSQLMRAGDRVLVGSDAESADAAVVHLRFVEADSLLVTKVEVGAVAMSHRSPDPPFLGDEIMEVALAEALSALRECDASQVHLVGSIHVENRASMRMAQRNEWEPMGPPSEEGYVKWALMNLTS